jgi:ABC-type amino acid transport system permease subunit
MFETLTSSDGFGPALLAVILGWTPVFVPLTYLAIWGRELPKKVYFVAVCSAFTLGLPVFFLIGLEAPLLIIQPLYDIFVFNSGLQDTPPFSWLHVALKAVTHWWWLATIIAFIAAALAWSSVVTWWLGRRWTAVTTALVVYKGPQRGCGADDA